MRVVNQDEFKNEKLVFSERIKDGAVFIYPTDTIYGMGCNALNSKSVVKVRQLKERWEKPFSVIAPSKEWILENCEIGAGKKRWINKLPGQYTLILKTKKGCVAKDVNNGLSTLGIRIPNHWISNVVSELGIPIITTSVNKSGSEFMRSLDDLDSSIKNGVEFIIYEGEKKGMPSKIVDLAGKSRITER